jgi:hypothetical protein
MGIEKNLYFQSSCVELLCVEAQRGSAAKATLLPAIRSLSNIQHTKSKKEMAKQPINSMFEDSSW